MGRSVVQMFLRYKAIADGVCMVLDMALNVFLIDKHKRFHTQ